MEVPMNIKTLLEQCGHVIKLHGQRGMVVAVFEDYPAVPYCLAMHDGKYYTWDMEELKFFQYDDQYWLCAGLTGNDAGTEQAPADPVIMYEMVRLLADYLKGQAVVAAILKEWEDETTT
jgi:hypothetical protein